MRLAARIGCVLLLFLSVSASQAGTTTYTYDALGRLVGESYACGSSITYTYDAAGNRTATSATAPGVCPPTAIDDYITTAYNTPATFDPRINDSDPNGYALTITGTGTPSHGSVVNNGGISLTYTPTSGFSGSDSLSYTISNGHGGTASATVHMTVQSQPVQPPVAVDDYVTTAYNTPATFDPRVNDSDPQGYPLTITGTGAPTHGSVVNNGGTSLTYTPTSGFSGSDSFSYTISNGHGGTASATVHMTVQSQAVQPPVAVDDYVSTTLNTGTTFDPRVNDSDPQGYPLTITGTGTPSHGSVVNNSGVSLTFTPTTGYTGSDSFPYTISNGHGGTASATVHVTITLPQPQAPDANLEFTRPPIFASIDPRAYTYPGETLTITAVGTPGHGTAVIQGGGTSIKYTATGGFSGQTSFTYTVTDGFGQTATGNVNVTVDTQ